MNSWKKLNFCDNFYPADIPKQKEKMSAGNRKMNTVESEMIETALEDDDNEDAVLKGFEGVLDAVDGEIDEEGDGDYVAEKEGKYCIYLNQRLKSSKSLIVK